MVTRTKLHQRPASDALRTKTERTCRFEGLERRTLMSAAAWATVDSFTGTNQDNSVKAMTSDAAGNVYAVGNSDQNSPDNIYTLSHRGVIREKVSGSTNWTEISSVANSYLENITVDAKTNVYACGQGTPGGWIVLERAAGQSNFTGVDDFGVANVGHCEALTTDSAGNVYAAGFIAIPTTKGSTTTYTRYWAVRKQAGGTGPFTTVDQFAVTSSNGVETSSAAHAKGATVISSGASAGLYVVGDNAGKWVVRKSTDAGKTWVTVDPGYVYDASNPGSASAQTVVGDASGNLFVGGYALKQTIVGYTGKLNRTPVYATTPHWVVRKSSNGGASWTVNDDFLMSPYQSQAEHQLAVDASGHVYAAVSGRDANNITHALVRANTGTDSNGVPNGSWVTIADNPGTTAYGSLNIGFAVDASGTLYAGGVDYDSVGNGVWVVRSPAVPAPLVAPAAATPALATFSTMAIASSTLQSKPLITTSAATFLHSGSRLDPLPDNSQIMDRSFIAPIEKGHTHSRRRQVYLGGTDAK